MTPGLVAHAFRASMISTAPSACEAPVIMLRKNSAWPGASIKHYVARAGAEADLRGVDGDALVALGLQRIKQERPFERHAAPRADRLQHLQLALGQAAGFVQQGADQGGFAVVDMADDDDANLRPRLICIDVVPLGVAETLKGRIMFIAALTPNVRQR